MNHSVCRFCKHIKRSFPFILILIAGILLTSLRFPGAIEPDLKNKVHIVVIDAGHGGKDPGALGSFAKEKDVVLGVALKLGNYIKENFSDVKVIYTRETDEFIPLFERADIANKSNADLFISIHANSSEKKNAYGAETFVMGEHKNQSNFEVAKTENNVITLEDDYTTKYEGFDPNSVESYIIFSLMQKTYLNQSLNFAGKIQDEFREKARREDRGVLQAGFIVLWRTTMPSVLVETGFISHPAEEKYLSSESGQDYIASAIFRAFREYKAEIENSSNFDAKPAENITDNIQVQENLTTYYKVQVFSSKMTINSDDPGFTGFNSVEWFASGKWNKYAVGKFTSYSEAEKNLEKIRERYPDAFIIGVSNGNIISVQDTKNILNK